MRHNEHYHIDFKVPCKPLKWRHTGACFMGARYVLSCGGAHLLDSVGRFISLTVQVVLMVCVSSLSYLSRRSMFLLGSTTRDALMPSARKLFTVLPKLGTLKGAKMSKFAHREPFF